MSSPRWETPDVEKMLKDLGEATTSANVGAFEVPLGAPLRRPVSAPDEVEIPPEFRELLGLDPKVP